MGPLHRRDSVQRFSDRSADYVRYRPGYPAAAIDWILDGLGPAEVLVAADVGAGTGISARLLADRGVQVVAVEPGEAMRASAAPHPRVQWVAGRADATGLARHSVDLVVCAQAFHWFDPTTALPEFARILRPNGRLAIVWNRRSGEDPFTARYREAILSVGGESTLERMAFDPAVIEASGLFTPMDRTSVPNSQRFDLDGLLGRARSASYVPKTGPDAERLEALLRTLHARYADAGGRVTLVYETEVFRAARMTDPRLGPSPDRGTGS